MSQSCLDKEKCQTMLWDRARTMTLSRWSEAQKRGDIQGRCSDLDNWKSQTKQPLE